MGFGRIMEWIFPSVSEMDSIVEIQIQMVELKQSKWTKKVNIHWLGSRLLDTYWLTLKLSDRISSCMVSDDCKNLELKDGCIF